MTSLRTLLPAPPCSLVGLFARHGIALGKPVWLQGSDMGGVVVDVAPGYFIPRDVCDMRYVVGREDLPRACLGAA